MIAFALTAALAVGAAPLPQAEDQWIYRDGLSSGPVASFLGWNYRSVLIRAACEQNVLLIEYFPGSGVAETDPPMTLYLDEAPFELRTSTTRDGDGLALQGRVPVTPQLLSVMASARHIMLGVTEPSADLDEPWHLGTAQPLQRIARHCIGF